MVSVILATVLNVIGTNYIERVDYPVNLQTDAGIIMNFNLSDRATKESNGWYALDENEPAPREGFYHIPVGYEKSESGYRRVWEERALVPAPVRYSVKKVISALRAAGKWSTVKAALIAADYYEEFLGSNYLAADDADFVAACAGLVAGGIVTQVELDALLSRCHWEAD